MEAVRLTQEAEEAGEDNDDGLATEHHPGHAGGAARLEGVLLEVRSVEVVEAVVVPQLQDTASEANSAGGRERPAVRVSQLREADHRREAAHLQGSLSVEQVAGVVREPGQGHAPAAGIQVFSGTVDTALYHLGHHSAVAPSEDVLEGPTGGCLDWN